ncbi:hypothetical protein NRY68_10995 [Acidithiobacillus ferrooxidans]|uniref:hypothetical protein n=1 Tax=Acidithiobacillus ferrooxidans TaxID=920 RepID=UPI002147EBFD|nr:hypothetical protein [Acidithiobacillus ferrooxidans]MCR1346302.1 hypothetical protein [Acidithiobacillus ferrooxidans]MCR1354395.1 hypothetical protein [Acidithiobacillus ferrooxidans]
MSKKSKKPTPVPLPTPCWFFRDRSGHRFGPYADAKEIRAILKNHRVGKVFEVATKGLVGPLLPATEFVMEDAEYHPVCPGDWLDAEKAKHRALMAAGYGRRYGHHTYRHGPVAGIHKPRYWKWWKTPNFGRKVRDTGHGCQEDGEPGIRVKLRVRCHAWDDFASCRARKSWKRYRDHQWREAEIGL